MRQAIATGMLLLSWALAACAPPASLFTLSDGRVAQLGEHDLTVGVGVGSLFGVHGLAPDPTQTVSTPFLGGGATYTAGLSKRVALQVGGAYVDSAKGGAPFLNGQIDVQAGVVPDPAKPIQLTYIGGFAAYGNLNGHPTSIGFSLRDGFVLSGPVAPRVRMFGAFRLDNTWTLGDIVGSPTGEYRKPDGTWPAWQAMMAGTASLGATFDLSRRSTIALELATSPEFERRTWGTFGGALWYRVRFGEPHGLPFKWQTPQEMTRRERPAAP